MLLPYTPLVSLRLAAIDTETTGLDIATARLVQIAVLPLTGSRLEGEGFEALVDPQIPMPKAAQEVHGISDRDLAGKPRFPDIFPEAAEALKDRVVVGYNTGFDIAMLEKECRLAGIEWRRPPALDVRLLARVVLQQMANDSLEALAEWLGAPVRNRHTARGDAEAAALVFAGLLPKLRERGIRTLGEAESACRTLLERAASLETSGGGGFGGALHSAPAAPSIYLQLDSYPYRHRVSSVMREPVFAAPDMPLDEAAHIMVDRKISALLVRAEDGAGVGIVTERDLLWSLARQVRGHGAKTLREVMSRPLQTVEEDDFVYRAIGRMDRLKIRHLAVAGPGGEITGIVSARGLLRQRATAAIALGDEIDRAPDLETLGLARAKLAAVAQSLALEDIGVREIAEVVSAELRALNARAAALAENWMQETGRGPAPCPFALLVLGSAGRGESLLSADQDNALVLARGEPGGPEDRWFAQFAEKLADLLDGAGVPYCKGGVMAKNAVWRHSVEGWRGTIQGWLSRSRPQDLLDVDIFFDGRAVYGETSLGEKVVDHAWRQASASPAFLRLLTETARDTPQPVSIWGGLKTDETGRIDVKRYGLMPVFTGARVLALKHGVRARSTPERLRGLKAIEEIPEREIDLLIDAHAELMSAIFLQQLRDIDNGVPPSARVEVNRMADENRRALKRALTNARRIGDLVGEGLVA